MVIGILKLSREPGKNREHILKSCFSVQELTCVSNGIVTPTILLIQTGIYIWNTNTHNLYRLGVKGIIPIFEIKKCYVSDFISFPPQSKLADFICSFTQPAFMEHWDSGHWWFGGNQTQHRTHSRGAYTEVGKFTFKILMETYASNQDGVIGTRFTLPPDISKKQRNNTGNNGF